MNLKQLILVRGSTTDYENFLRALRKRNGGWQGYLAEIMDVTQVGYLRIDSLKWHDECERLEITVRGYLVKAN